MDLDDSSPLVPLATKLFTSPGQRAERGVMSDAHPQDPFVRRLLTAASRKSIADVAKIAAEKYRRPVSEVWEQLLDSIVDESMASPDLRSSSLVVYRFDPKMLIWGMAKIIESHLEAIVLGADEEMTLDELTIKMTRRGVALVASWASGSASSSRMFGELPSLQKHIASNTKKSGQSVILPVDESWVAAAGSLFTFAMDYAEIGDIVGEDNVGNRLVRPAILAVIAENGETPSAGARSVAAIRLAKELASRIVNFPMPSSSIGSGALGSGGAGAAVLGIALGAVGMFAARRRGR